jgi:hypothetical protein
MTPAIEEYFSLASVESTSRYKPAARHAINVFWISCQNLMVANIQLGKLRNDLDDSHRAHTLMGFLNLQSFVAMALLLSPHANHKMTLEIFIDQCQIISN